MDIRNFFGSKSNSGKNASETAASVSSTALTSNSTSVENSSASKRKRVIVDDEDEEMFEECPKATVESNVSCSGTPMETHDNDSTNENIVKRGVSQQPQTLLKEKLVSESSTTCKPATSVDVQSVESNDATGICQDLEAFITWKVGESIPYLALVQTFEEISKTSGRLDKENLFTRLFRSVIVTMPSELDSIVYLASNNVSPAYEGMELGIGDSLLVKAVCEATGRKKDAVEEAYEREGDLGTVALTSRANQKTLSFAAKPKPLLAKFVLEQFRIITQIKGDKAQGRKVEVIKALMVKCQGAEAKFIVRALQGKLRIGTAAQTVLVALAHAFAQTPTASVRSMMLADKAEAELKLAGATNETCDGGSPTEEDNPASSSSSSAAAETPPAATEPAVDMLVLLDKVHEKETPEAVQLRTKSRLTKEERQNLAEIAVKRAFSECPNLTMLVTALLTKPIYRLYQACRLTTGVPVAPMLAKPTKEINEVLRRLSGQPFTMEYKYDGERAQVHLCEDLTVRIFSRNSEDNTNKYPDLLEVMKRARGEHVRSCIIDAEVVAYDREKGCLLPFQVLSTRKRKVEEGEEDSQKVKIILQAFDLLQINGKSLLRESLRTRRAILHSSFQHAEGFFHFASGADHVENGDTAPIEAFLQEACGAMCEGLMVKTLDDNASYEPSKRSLNWLKLKKDYIDGMGVCDSVDLVVLGGYYGRGKRTNTYGAYLMACYDAENDEFQSVCKVGTGFKDEDLARLFEQMKKHVVPSKRKPINYNVGEPLYPDDWFEAAVVWELQAADLSKSSVHKGGYGKVGEAGRGIGLRFPRYIRDRPDKNPENATNADQIVDMYESQGGIEGAANVNGDDDDEDDGI